MNQNEEDVIYFDPIFDFSEFRADSGHLYDCTIDLGDGTTVSAHQAILSTTSEFFFNAFTSGMTEQETRHVKLEVNPGNIFPLVLNWMYNGHIDITPDNIMALSVVTRFYGIGRLLASVERTMEILWINDYPEGYQYLIEDAPATYLDGFKAALVSVYGYQKINENLFVNSQNNISVKLKEDTGYQQFYFILN